MCLIWSELIDRMDVHWLINLYNKHLLTLKGSTAIRWCFIVLLFALIINYLGYLCYFVFNIYFSHKLWLHKLSMQYKLRYLCSSWGVPVTSTYSGIIMVSYTVYLIAVLSMSNYMNMLNIEFHSELCVHLFHWKEIKIIFETKCNVNLLKLSYKKADAKLLYISVG